MAASVRRRSRRHCHPLRPALRGTRRASNLLTTGQPAPNSLVVSDGAFHNGANYVEVIRLSDSAVPSMAGTMADPFDHPRHRYPIPVQGVLNALLRYLFRVLCKQSLAGQGSLVTAARRPARPAVLPRTNGLPRGLAIELTPVFPFSLLPQLGLLYGELVKAREV